MTTWNKPTLYALLLLICSIGVIALFPLTDWLIALIQNPDPAFLLTLAGERQLLWTWYAHLVVSALTAIVSIYFGVIGVRQAELEKSKGKWLGILFAILSGFFLFSLAFSLTV